MSSNFFTQGGDYCEQTRNVDQMLSRFKNDRQQITGLLNNDVSSLSTQLWESLLSQDHHCLLKMGKGDLSYGLINYYVCPQCKNMRRLTELPGNRKITIECGDRTGEQFAWTEKTVHRTFMKNSPVFPGEKRLSVSAPKETRWECDPFTSGVLVQMSLDKNVHVQPLHIAWVCGEHGYLLLEQPDIGTIDHLQKNRKYLNSSEDGETRTPLAMANSKTPLSKDVVSGIVQQLFAVTYQLQKWKVAHLHPGTESILFTKTPVSYISDGVHVTSPVTLWLGNWQSAGMSSGDNRIWSSCPISEIELNQHKPFSPIDMFKNSDEGIVYRLKRSPKTKYMFWTLQCLGFPIYCSSFNLYAFLVVLLCEKAFYVTFMMQFKDLWDMLWVLSEDREKIERRLQDRHDTGVVDRNGVLDLLTDLHLKSDAIDVAWKYLVSLNK